MNKSHETTSPRSAACELRPADLSLVVWESDPEGQITITSETLTWRHEASTLLSDRGLMELEAAFRQLATRHKLSGVPINLVLNGDYCVTRAVSGTAERVRNELAQLERRSALYLTLGHGPKIPGGSVQQIDARHQHALLTVVHQRTLQALLDASARADWQLNIIEPSLVALCRLIGHTGGDHEGPAMVVNLSPQKSEVGISHRGQLLLDYRPASCEAGEETASIVARHMNRIDRYCNRYVSFAGGRPQHIYLSGHPGLVVEARDGFQQKTDLPVTVLEGPSVDRDWKHIGQPPGPAEMAALGSCLRGKYDDEATGPNLLEKLRTISHVKLSTLLMHTAWPLAAALLLALTAWVAVGWQAGHARSLERRVAEIEEPARQARLLRGDVVRLRQELDQYQLLEAALQEPSWDGLTATIAQCMPPDVWLTDVSSDEHGVLVLLGASFSEDGVFELVRWLESVPQLKRVDLRGTEQTTIDHGRAVRFRIHCQIAGEAREGEFSDVAS